MRPTIEQLAKQRFADELVEAKIKAMQQAIERKKDMEVKYERDMKSITTTMQVIENATDIRNVLGADGMGYGYTRN